MRFPLSSMSRHFVYFVYPACLVALISAKTAGSAKTEIFILIVFCQVSFLSVGDTVLILVSILAFGPCSTAPMSPLNKHRAHPVRLSCYRSFYDWPRFWHLFRDSYFTGSITATQTKVAHTSAVFAGLRLSGFVSIDIIANVCSIQE